MILFRRLVFLVAVSLAFCGCKDWWPYGRDGATKLAKGSIYENLEKKGDYGLFLKALDITGYREAVDKSSLLTVFAPNNEAFREYMTNVLQISDLSEVAQDEEKLELLTRTISYHIIENEWSVDAFLGFTMSSDPDAPRGDGSVYKYKTMAREPIGYYRDPLSRRDVQLYKREKYLPVFSTNLFKNKGADVASIEAEYKRLYPDVNWQGSDNRLYVGNAAVLDMGIPTDNGYLYTIDKVAIPQPTIYSMLDASAGGELATNHKIFARIIQRMNRYTWDKTLSTLYALPGDSLFHQYTFADPAFDARMPELASEWTYHDEIGSNIERSMKWAVTAMIPTDAALETWIRDNFVDLSAGKDINQIIDEMPYNTLYHIAIAHFFDKRDLTIPYQLFNKGITGIYSENFKPAENQIVGIKMAANGIVYITNTVNTSNVFSRFTRPLFTVNEGKSFQLFAEAFNRRDLYMTVSAADEQTPYTLFVVNDNRLENQAGNTRLRVFPNAADPMRSIIQRQSSSGGSWGSYTYGNYGNMDDVSVGDFVTSHLAYGHIPAPVALTTEQIALDEHHLRYYKMQRQTNNGASQYIYALDGEFYDEMDNPLGYRDLPNSYGEADGIKYGTVHEIQEVIRGRGANENVRLSIWLVAGRNNSEPWKPAYKFKMLLRKCGILEANNEEYVTEGWNAQKDFMLFAPSNAAIEEAEAAGPGVVIPYYEPTDDGTVDAEVQAQRKAALKRWCQFYFIDRFQNNIDNYIFPGLDPYFGQTEEAYEHVLRTAYDYKTLQDALYCKVGWDPADSFRIYLKNKEGVVAKTLMYGTVDPGASDQTPKLLMPAMRGTSGIVFVIDKCFPASSMIPGDVF